MEITAIILSVVSIIVNVFVFLTFGKVYGRIDELKRRISSLEEYMNYSDTCFNDIKRILNAPPPTMEDMIKQYEAQVNSMDASYQQDIANARPNSDVISQEHLAQLLKQTGGYTTLDDKRR